MDMCLAANNIAFCNGLAPHEEMLTRCNTLIEVIKAQQTLEFFFPKLMSAYFIKLNIMHQSGNYRDKISMFKNEVRPTI